MCVAWGTVNTKKATAFCIPEDERIIVSAQTKYFSLLWSIYMVMDFLAEGFVLIQSVADVGVLLVHECDMHQVASFDVELFH